MNILNKFLRYVKIDTQSNPYSKTSPSTEKQKELSLLLVKELKEMGLDAFMCKDGYVYSKIPKNTNKAKYNIGFIAHVDTSFDAPGANVNPRIIKNYDGGTIVLNDFYQMNPQEFPNLLEVIGDDLIVTDGNTLLGADDKAGVAEIMQAAQEIISDKNLLHGDIYIAFTPDEEIGRGTDHFDLDFFRPDFAYTFDGGRVGSIESENFNAAAANVIITGKSIHPGTAKDKMINANKVAMEFNSLLPNEAPENTSGYEGFYHLSASKGSVESATLEYIIRDFDWDNFQKRKKVFETIKNKLNKKYNYQAVEIKLRDQYFNMALKLKDKEYILEIAKNAILKTGISPIFQPIRGGTDGAMLTYKGLPTPNLGMGGYNYHGRYEYASINQMEKAVEIIKNIVRVEK
ncbi:MAG: peptidase T [Acholeplasmataceae bacterium]|jgi:tripeptide aminopeptidase|nr:peptidase T [Acholeplasmataceae bacterium]